MLKENKHYPNKKTPPPKQTALIQDNELDSQGQVTNSRRLCIIQQVEVKCLIKILPIWASGILCFIPNAQQSTFPVSQAMKMDLHIGPHFEIPSASFSVVSLITIGIWIPCYELFMQPSLAKIPSASFSVVSLSLIYFSIYSLLPNLKLHLHTCTSTCRFPYLCQ